MSGSTGTGKLGEAQLGNLELQSEKMYLDLASQRKDAATFRLSSQTIQLMTLALSIAGFLWGLKQYSDEQAKNRSEHLTQSLRDTETREREFMKPWLESQRAIYVEALSVAARLANARDPKERSVGDRAFWELYHGRMVLVETKTVSHAMVEFGHCLDGTENCTPNTMNERVRVLATAMAESMAATARMTYGDFSANQFRYVASASASRS